MMQRWRHIIGLLCLAALVITGCAYYNTFYNAKRTYAQAERDNRPKTQQNQTQQQGSSGQGRSSTPSSPSGVQSPDKYRKVIETCSKLLEFYPNSRWVDDALMLMGMSYYRLQDLPRAERKFTELITIFPKSQYVVEAGIWKARILTDQKNYAAAITLIQETLPKIHGVEARASALFLLGNLFFQEQRWSDAADQFQAAVALRQPRDQRVNALFRLGLARQNQGNGEQARDAFAAVARTSGDIAQAYDATIRWSKCEAALKNYDRAEEILLNAQSNDRFLAYADNLPLELAALAVETGRVEDGIARYEEFVALHAKGELRGLAFYRLALVHRDRRADLSKSKTLLDSVAAAGASKDISDSARIAGEDITKGLLAFEAITELQAAIDSLQTVVSHRAQSKTALPSAALPPPAPNLAPVLPDSGRASAPIEQSPDTLPDSTRHALSDSLPESRTVVTSQSADSILRALSRRDSVRRDSSQHGHGPTNVPPKSAAKTNAPAVSDSLSPEAQLIEYRQLLHIAYLRCGEFYDQSLADPDSALRYYRLAAVDTMDWDTYWKANLYLAASLPMPDSALSPEARQCYQNVLNAPDVPIDAANVARRALNLPEISAPIPPQQNALLAAESAWIARSVSPDSALRLYAAVVRMDSTTAVARTALFAQADIYENALLRPDSVNSIYEALIALYPNAAWVHRLHVRMRPPDSASVFLKTDDQLAGNKVSVESLLQPTSSDSGWPPPEETLRRQRYRL